jgi:hypothetical protein
LVQQVWHTIFSLLLLKAWQNDAAECKSNGTELRLLRICPWFWKLAQDMDRNDIYLIISFFRSNFFIEMKRSKVKFYC